MSAKKPQLLSREPFREGTLARSNHQCVRCGRKATPDGKVKLDAHHIMERRLWTGTEEFGGYFLDNGATLCDTGYEKTNGEWSCHLMAGMTLISPDEIRKMAGIDRIHLPEHFYEDQPYTVWGDPILPNGQRMRGELFWDESVQLMLKMGGVLDKYTPYVRHPRTYHLPFSGKVEEGDVGDDKILRDLSRFEGEQVVVTAKMDGMQATLYRDYMHARTTDFKSDITWHWLQNFHKKFGYEIPDGYRVNVENLWGGPCTAIQYSKLPLYTMAWMMWDDKNYCLDWDTTKEWCILFGDVLKEAGVEQGLPIVPTLYEGIWDEDVIRNLYQPTYDGDPLEGFVVRPRGRFHYKDFRNSVGKYVRRGHRVRHGGELIRNRLETEA